MTVSSIIAQASISKTIESYAGTNRGISTSYGQSIQSGVDKHRERIPGGELTAGQLNEITIQTTL